MDDEQEARARELVEDLETVGGKCGLMAKQGSVVMRCPGAPYTDSPMLKYPLVGLRGNWPHVQFWTGQVTFSELSEIGQQFTAGKVRGPHLTSSRLQSDR